MQNKKLYDIEYRKKNKEKIKNKKRKYYFDNIKTIKVKHKAYRDAHKKEHLEYIRTKTDKKKKKLYDKIRLAKNKYGEFWECMILVNKINKMVIERVPDIYERRKMRGVSKRNIIKRAFKRYLLYGWNFNY